MPQTPTTLQNGTNHLTFQRIRRDTYRVRVPDPFTLADGFVVCEGRFLAPYRDYRITGESPEGGTIQFYPNSVPGQLDTVTLFLPRVDALFEVGNFVTALQEREERISAKEAELDDLLTRCRAFLHTAQSSVPPTASAEDPAPDATESDLMATVASRSASADSPRPSAKPRR